MPEHHTSKKKMLLANTEMLTKYQKEHVMIEHLIDFIKEVGAEKMTVMVKNGLSNSLFSLPYLITVDFINQKIQVLFHREVFESVGEC